MTNSRPSDADELLKNEDLLTKPLEVYSFVYSFESEKFEGAVCLFMIMDLSNIYQCLTFRSRRIARYDLAYTFP
jgi:hypothetical protein